ncbi:MAG: ABC transporter permease [Deltaproteobacteria bacterium]|nr:ABC transporter permease [Deltaproteobacteria bacterium]
MIRVIFLKELIDHLRDKRTLSLALVLPVLGPLMLVLLLNAVAGWLSSGKAPKVGVDGGENAPNLVAFMRNAGLEVSPAPPKFEDALREGKLDAVVVVGSSYAEHFVKGRPARLELWVDSSRNEGRQRARRVRWVLDGYSSQVGAARLFERGVAPELAHAVDLEEIEVATSQQLAATFLSMVPLFIVIVSFAGGMHLAIDSTAGERERKSLEPLLVNPVSRSAIVLGKWLATSVVALSAVVLTIGGFAIALEKAPLAELGARANVDAAVALTLLGVAVPLVLLAAALQITFALFAKTFKEAQLVSTLLMFVAMTPGMVLTFHPMDPSTPHMLIPGIAQVMLVSSALRGDAIRIEWVMLAAIVPLATAAIALRAASRLLASERILFSR